MERRSIIPENLDTLTRDQLIEVLAETERRLWDTIDKCEEAKRVVAQVPPPAFRAGGRGLRRSHLRLTQRARQQLLAVNEGFIKTIKSTGLDGDYCETTHTIVAGRLLVRRVGVRHFDEERTADALETFSFLNHNLHLLRPDGVEEFARKAHTQKGDLL